MLDTLTQDTNSLAKVLQTCEACAIDGLAASAVAPGEVTALRAETAQAECWTGRPILNLTLTCQCRRKPLMEKRG